MNRVLLYFGVRARQPRGMEQTRSQAVLMGELRSAVPMSIIFPWSFFFKVFVIVVLQCCVNFC